MRVQESPARTLKRLAVRVCQLPALRAGFVGFPTNPRWNAVKFHAWKVGRQWRNDLDTGELKVRTSDSILVHRDEEEPPGKPECSLTKTVQKFGIWNLKLDSLFSVLST